MRVHGAVDCFSRDFLSPPPPPPQIKCKQSSADYGQKCPCIVLRVCVQVNMCVCIFTAEETTKTDNSLGCGQETATEMMAWI